MERSLIEIYLDQQTHVKALTGVRREELGFFTAFNDRKKLFEIKFAICTPSCELCIELLVALNRDGFNRMYMTIPFDLP